MTLSQNWKIKIPKIDSVIVLASEMFLFNEKSLASVLTHYRLMSPSYRNQHIDLLCKSIDWFLSDREIGSYCTKFNCGGEEKLCCNFWDFCTLVQLNHNPSPFYNFFGKIQPPLPFFSPIITPCLPSQIIHIRR